MKQIESIPYCRDVNYMLLPVTIYDMNDDGMKAFNEMYKKVLSSNAKPIQRTPSGGIKLPIPIGSYDVRRTNNCLELTVIGYRMFRLQFRTSLGKLNDSNMSGRMAFRKFKKWAKSFGIDMDELAIENGMDIKKTIPTSKIVAVCPIGEDVEYNNVCHVDFHNSYPAGLANTHPEFKKMMEWIYDKRKDDEDAKHVLNYSIGFMQSKHGCGAKWSHLAKDAIQDNIDRVDKLADAISKNGGKILLYNTDGFWFQGNPTYHDENEGSALGQWHYDHVRCKLRIKSSGAYEYIENGKYYPVVRGLTGLDSLLPREKWKWGDIFHSDCVVIRYQFIEGVGIVRYED